MFSNQEMVDMLEEYFKSNGNSRRARETYARKYPRRRIPNQRTFVSNVQRLRDFGMFHPKMADSGRVRNRRMDDTVENILDNITNHPDTSTRRLALQYEISQSTVDRCLREEGLHPYHVQRVQALLPADRSKRMEFCQWILTKNAEDTDFLRYILFTDEAGFTREGIFNMHNTHIWSVENPHSIREAHHQQQFGVNMWGGIVNDQLLGPREITRRLTGDLYLNFLQNDLEELLEDVPLIVVRHLWLQHDGAPPHSSRRVSDWLNEKYGNQWIGRFGPVAWPPRSPDLNPCDFFLWGYMKQLVYSSEIRDVEDLRQRVDGAAVRIRENPMMLQNVRNSLLRRAQACLDADGGHFEHLL